MSSKIQPCRFFYFPLFQKEKDKRSYTSNDKHVALDHIPALPYAYHITKRNNYAEYSADHDKCQHHKICHKKLHRQLLLFFSCCKQHCHNSRRRIQHLCRRKAADIPSKEITDPHQYSHYQCQPEIDTKEQFHLFILIHPRHPPTFPFLFSAP